VIMRKMNSVTVHELRATITGEAVSAKPSGIPPARLRDCVRGVSERNHAEDIGCSSLIVDGSPSIERARAFTRRGTLTTSASVQRVQGNLKPQRAQLRQNASECLAGSGQTTRKILLHGTTCSYSPSVLSNRYQRLPGLTKVGLATFRRTRYIHAVEPVDV
jgi:hypothetical protein